MGTVKACTVKDYFGLDARGLKTVGFRFQIDGRNTSRYILLL